MPKDIDLMIQGYQEFKQKYYQARDSASSDLVENGQKPKILVIACSDSRVDPAIIMNAKPGDLFVIRNVANLVPPYEEDNSYHGTSAALEFGVCTLGIKHIIVFGHSQCGGIAKLIENARCGAQEKNFINKWVELSKPAYDYSLQGEKVISHEQQTTICAQYSLLNSLNNLKTFPWIIDKIEQGYLSLHAWYFDLLTGSIKCFDHTQKVFVELEQVFALT